MISFHFLALNRQGLVIHKSDSFKTYGQAMFAGCEFLKKNKEVKEISVR